MSDDGSGGPVAAPSSEAERAPSSAARAEEQGERAEVAGGGATAAGTSGGDPAAPLRFPALPPPPPPAAAVAVFFPDARSGVRAAAVAAAASACSASSSTFISFAAAFASCCCLHSRSNCSGSLQSRALRGNGRHSFSLLLLLLLFSPLPPSLSLSLSLPLSSSSSEEEEEGERELPPPPPPPPPPLPLLPRSRPEAASGRAESRQGSSVALAVTRPSGIAQREGLSGVAGGGHAGKKRPLPGTGSEGEGPVAGGGGWSSTAVVSASTGSPGLRSKSTPPILTRILPERSTSTFPREPGWRSEAQASDEAVSFLSALLLLRPSDEAPAAGGGERAPPKGAPGEASVGRREGTWSRQKPSPSASSSSPPEPKAESGTVVGCFFLF